MKGLQSVTYPQIMKTIFIKYIDEINKLIGPFVADANGDDLTRIIRKFFELLFPKETFNYKGGVINVINWFIGNNILQGNREAIDEYKQSGQSYPNLKNRFIELRNNILNHVFAH